MVCAAAASTALVVGAESAGAIVPGPNGRIAFESSRTGNNDIFTMGPDGSTQINITNHPANDVFPAWSPDGRKITFASDRAEAGNLDVYVMNADGSGLMRLTNAPGEDRGTSWTSDGQTIVFHSSRFRDATHTFDVFKMNADGTNQTKIFTNGSAAYVCGNSTNGIIVFNSSGDPLGTNPLNPPVGTNPPARDFEIFTMNMNGGDVFQVTNNTVLDSGPKWSPDCSRISYNSLDAGGSLDIHRINANGTNDVNLTNTPGIFDAFSAWSPNGNRIVFSSNRDVNFEIYTMNSSNGANVRRLTNTGLGQADFRSDWGTNTATPPDTALVCRPDVNGSGNPIQVCTVSDTNGIRFVQVKNVDTNQQQVGLAFDCAATREVEFRVPAGAKYNIVVTDCAAARNMTRFVLTEDGRVRLNDAP